MTQTVSFVDAYKEWRNRTRIFNRDSIIQAAMHRLAQPTANQLDDLKRAPWLTMLVVKWVCQDKMMKSRVGENISTERFNDLCQRLWRMPDQLDLGSEENRPFRLVIRQLLNSQIGFQRPLSPGFVREAALLAKQPKNSALRTSFEAKTGVEINDFIDLSLALYSPILNGYRRILLSWFDPMRSTYSDRSIENFLTCISRTTTELVDLCRQLPHANRKVASELYEFPVLSRYPFLRKDSDIECWHPAIFYRGMEGLVHSILSEEGENYILPFSKLFEKHVIAEARTIPGELLDENAIRKIVSPGVQVPDGLLAFQDANMFIESKAGIFDESVMVAGHSEIFAHKTKALKKAVDQARSACLSLQREKRAPSSVLNADRHYLLIVTNRELGAGRGTALAGMYPPDTLDHRDKEGEKLLPLDHIYVLSIDDFERLAAGARNKEFELPEILEACVLDDSNPDSARQFFEQHLNKHRIPNHQSSLVKCAIDESSERLKLALKRQKQ
jgi:hypothetical protein